MHVIGTTVSGHQRSAVAFCGCRRGKGAAGFESSSRHGALLEARMLPGDGYGACAASDRTPIEPLGTAECSIPAKYGH